MDQCIICTVVAGRGLKNKTGLFLLQQLAELLGADVAATRGAVEEGWCSADQMVGMSGKTIHTDIYLAFGVSGTHFHTVGIKGDPYVIAVNTNPKARIFEMADLCIMEDAQTVLQRLITYLKKTCPVIQHMTKHDWIKMLSNGIR